MHLFRQFKCGCDITRSRAYIGCGMRQRHLHSADPAEYAEHRIDAVVMIYSGIS